jgi:methyl-accepting chemotaxis protein
MACTYVVKTGHSLALQEICNVTEAIARGEFSKTLIVTSESDGEVERAKRMVNKMTAGLRQFASEILRVTYEVGTKGKLGERARTDGLEGTWLELTEAVNNMADQFTNQTRNVASVTNAVAAGDTTLEIPYEAQGTFSFIVRLNHRRNPRSFSDN